MAQYPQKCVHVYQNTCARIFIVTLYIIAPIQDTTFMFTNRNDKRNYNMLIQWTTAQQR